MRLCVPDRDAGPHAGNARHPVSLRLTIILRRVQADRLPEVDFAVEEIETRRQNADDGAQNRIHLHLAPDNVVIAAEPALPEPVTDQQQCVGRNGSPILFSGKQAAAHRLYA